jgi:hypothetical protein
MTWTRLPVDDSLVTVLETQLPIPVLRITLCEDGVFTPRPLSEWAVLCSKPALVQSSLR